MYLNRWEIDELFERFKEHKLLGRGIRWLAYFRDIVDERSDGWSDWIKPQEAAAKLCKLFHDSKMATGKSATEEELKKAVRPLIAFCTRYKYPLPSEEMLSGPVRISLPESERIVALEQSAVGLIEAAKHLQSRQVDKRLNGQEWVKFRQAIETASRLATEAGVKLQI